MIRMIVWNNLSLLSIRSTWVPASTRIGGAWRDYSPAYAGATFTGLIGSRAIGMIDQEGVPAPREKSALSRWPLSTHRRQRADAFQREAARPSSEPDTPMGVIVITHGSRPRNVRYTRHSSRFPSGR
jgi:hypothetical protein